MKRIRLATAIILFSQLFIQLGHAYEGFGVCNHGKETIPSVVCYSPAVLRQTTVTGGIKVTGSLQAESITARDLTVEGAVSISDSSITGAVNITGTLNADHVVFKQGVAVESDTIALNHSQIGGLLTVTSLTNSPTIQLQCNSVIKGSVLFDGKAGIVQVTNDSSVQGKVVNGSLEFVTRKCQ